MVFMCIYKAMKLVVNPTFTLTVRVKVGLDTSLVALYKTYENHLSTKGTYLKV